MKATVIGFVNIWSVKPTKMRAIVTTSTAGPVSLNKIADNAWNNIVLEMVVPMMRLSSTCKAGIHGRRHSQVGMNGEKLVS